MRLKAPKFWYQQPDLNAYLLSPFAAIYRSIIWIREKLYKWGLKKIITLPVPVIVIGNITVGGTGKTPLVIWLANFLKKNGHNPGIISRGYGSDCPHYPYLVTATGDPTVVGDEPLLIAQKTNLPMVIAPDRVAAAQQLLAQHNCDIIISDDGLQHYRLGRTTEIAVIDGQRQFGNGFCLPAGPLREPRRRLNAVDYIVFVITGENMVSPLPKNSICIGQIQLKFGTPYHLSNPDQTKPLSEFKEQKIHAVAGIGNPQRFFAMLRDNGLKIIEHPFPDHHQFTQNDLTFPGDNPIILTEKDAIKCREFTLPNCWVIPLDTVIEENLQLTWRETLCYNRPYINTKERS